MKSIKFFASVALVMLSAACAKIADNIEPAAISTVKLMSACCGGDWHNNDTGYARSDIGEPATVTKPQTQLTH